MMERFAPNTAPPDTPKVEGDAMELLRVVCITRPATDRPAPAMIAANTRGIRIFQMIRLWALMPPPSSASSASPKVMLEEPIKRLATAVRKTASTISRVTAVYFLCFCFSRRSIALILSRMMFCFPSIPSFLGLRKPPGGLQSQEKTHFLADFPIRGISLFQGGRLRPSKGKRSGKI